MLWGFLATAFAWSGGTQKHFLNIRMPSQNGVDFRVDYGLKGLTQEPVAARVGSASRSIPPRVALKRRFYVYDHSVFDYRTLCDCYARDYGLAPWLDERNEELAQNTARCVFPPRAAPSFAVARPPGG